MLPKTNDVLYLQVLSQSGLEEMEEEHPYKSRVSELNPHFMLIEMPMDKSGQWFKPYVGEELAIYYIGADSAKHCFLSTVLGYKEDVLPLVVIQSPDPTSIIKIQRRQYFRVPAELEVALQWKERTDYLCITYNIGGGGIALLFDGDVSIGEGERVEGWLLLPMKNGATHHVKFAGEVIRVSPFEGTTKNLVTLKFVDIAEKDRQSIIRYCFDRQLEFRKQ